MEEISYDDTSLLDVSLNVEVGNYEASDPVPVPACTSTPKPKKKCNECNYQTSSTGNLSRHKKKHRNERVVCSKCSKSYRALYDLQQHIRIIHNHNQLMCERCSRRFNTRTALARHRAIHHSDRSRFICDKCGKGFHERATYIGHVNKHIGFRPYVCSECGASFGLKCNQKRHEKACPVSNKKNTHTCDTCGAELNSKATLQEHVKGKHGPKNLLCQCGKSFSWRPSFARHRKRCRFANNS